MLYPEQAVSSAKRKIEILKMLVKGSVKTQYFNCKIQEKMLFHITEYRFEFPFVMNFALSLSE